MMFWGLSKGLGAAGADVALVGFLESGNPAPAAGATVKTELLTVLHTDLQFPTAVSQDDMGDDVELGEKVLVFYQHLTARVVAGNLKGDSRIE
jgi:hypothetical protein